MLVVDRDIPAFRSGIYNLGVGFSSSSSGDSRDGLGGFESAGLCDTLK